MLNVTTKTIKTLDTTGIKRGMILSLEIDMRGGCRDTVVVMDVKENKVEAMVLSKVGFGKIISITENHTYKNIKEMEIVDKNKCTMKPLFKIDPDKVVMRDIPTQEEVVEELKKKIADSKWEIFFGN